MNATLKKLSQQSLHASVGLFAAEGILWPEGFELHQRPHAVGSLPRLEAAELLGSKGQCSVQEGSHSLVHILPSVVSLADLLLLLLLLLRLFGS